MTDRIETLGSSLVQHGRHNDRIYLMSLAQTDLPELLPRLDELGRDEGYSKIFAKIPAAVASPFLAEGYEQEAAIPGFYRGSEEAVFLGKYLADERRTETQPDLVESVIATALEKGGEAVPEPPLPGDVVCRVAAPADTAEMAELYREVFPTYPFPIHDSGYLEQTMADNVVYFGVWHEQGELLALSSAEMDLAGHNVEMTDFATLPERRGQGLATRLLAGMESVMAERGMRMAYTIARAYSYGMNITFAKLGYAFGGTLTRNTQISGDLESMNVWYKPLPA